MSLFTCIIQKIIRNIKTSLSSYELPPTTIAKSLPVNKRAELGERKDLEASTRSSLKRKRPPKNALDNDTPRAFARLMAFHRGIKPPSGLDDGVVKPKKRTPALKVPEETIPHGESAGSSTMPKIQPGERMAEFHTRVDAALPVSGLIGKGTGSLKNLPGIKTPQTKMERRMQRMQKEWREVEAKRKEKLEEALEEAENGEEYVDMTTSLLVSKPSRKGKRRKGNDDDDPWAAIAQAQYKTTMAGGLAGLHDVVQAPPQIKKIPKEKFKVRNGAKVDVLDVPSAAGSLRRREELGQARRSVVEGYRQMMKQRSGVTISRYPYST